MFCRQLGHRCGRRYLRCVTPSDTGVRTVPVFENSCRVTSRVCALVCRSGARARVCGCRCLYIQVLLWVALVV